MDNDLWTMDDGNFVEGREGGAMGIDNLQGEGFLTTTLDQVIAWARKNSLWPMPMGISCCAIEMMATASPRFDISRFGSEVMRFTPRQCDVMIVAGTVTYKMSKVVRKIYDQMPDPKWVISMGACASSGGMFRSYSVVQGIDQFIPVDVFVAGCPPRPEALLNALIELQKKVQREQTGDTSARNEKIFIPESAS
jgi:NADH-quinone oxidoreductase subunit B